METVLLFAVLSGLDNLHASSVIGLAGVKSARKWLWAGQFCLWEALMPFVGFFAGSQLFHYFGKTFELLGPIVLCLCGLIILYQVMREQDSTEVINSRMAFFALPFSLSIDNLFAGVGLGTMGYPVLASALCIGVVSGAMCLAGMFLGGWVRKWIPGNVEAVSGVYLILLSVFMLAKQEYLVAL